MDPEWHKDNKSIQPSQLPHFEVAGPQVDNEIRAKAMKIVLERTGAAALVLLAVVILLLIPTAMEGQSTEFARMDKSVESSFKGKIRMTRLSVERSERIEGWFFDAKAGTTKDGSQFPFARNTTNVRRRGNLPMEFVICHIRLQNNAREGKFRINPYSFVLTTTSGISYKTDLAINKYRDRLKPGSLKPGEERTGALVFKMPKGEGLDTLEIMDSGGPITKIKL